MLGFDFNPRREEWQSYERFLEGWCGATRCDSLVVGPSTGRWPVAVRGALGRHLTVLYRQRRAPIPPTLSEVIMAFKVKLIDKQDEEHVDADRYEDDGMWINFTKMEIRKG